ncbi:Ferredoxin subunit of nitrite reductase or a ring-hydroxylating dioxygenase [Actinacidiphila alni]|uniref:Cytochrome bc1 complex Rieske iron-sulfur subunit n=1 Tax=Actinacidiphila alni TaxID=380248 RepID=A0A1I2KKS4_9ACTN|nr:Rieske (2Fe-2S) protein [Actinacidiphila alni]SFF65711.1 Ferredoxin subunit of nitrite reductase or a ring-hydroxylating dioxygenase [Actinacidiphila alni]
MAETPRFPVPPTRRRIVAAAGGVGLAAALAACGNSDDSSNDASSDTSSPSSSAPATDPTTSDAGAAPSTSAAAGGGTPLGKTSDIPVGGGKIFADQKVVVTQPTAGQYKAFSSTCTHQGCQVASVSDGTINCPCHGSKFHVADGSVAGGPAMAPLPPEKVTVSGGQVMLDS